MFTSPFASTPSPSKHGIIIGVSIACTAVALLSITRLTFLFQRRQRKKFQALAEKLGPKPWERREADGKMVVPVRYELEGSRPVVHEIGVDGRGGERGREGEGERRVAIGEPETGSLGQSQR